MRLSLRTRQLSLEILLSALMVGGHSLDRNLPEYPLDAPPDRRSLSRGWCGNDFFKDQAPFKGTEAEAIPYLANSSDPLQTQLRAQNQSRISKLAMRELQITTIPVKLGILYDESFWSQFSLTYPWMTEKALESFVRNLIFATQLVFEQEEMYNSVKINLVVVGLAKCDAKFTQSAHSDTILSQFAHSKMIKNADINILLIHRTMFGSRDPGNSERFKVLGLAIPGAFCGSGELRPVLAVQVYSMGVALTLAHELAHSFGSLHDGDNSAFSVEERNCADGKHIMARTSGPGKTRWSWCTVAAIKRNFERVSTYSCIMNEHRRASAKPFKPEFDFTRNEENARRRILPGEAVTIDEQCALALGKTSVSMLNKYGQNEFRGFDTCHALLCSLNDQLEVEIGAAPDGSQCLPRPQMARCEGSYCISRNTTTR